MRAAKATSIPGYEPCTREPGPPGAGSGSRSCSRRTPFPHSARRGPDTLRWALCSLVCGLATAAAASNYVRLSDSGRYFQLEDGSDFLPIGHNEGVDWPYLANLYPRSQAYDPMVTRRYFNRLRDYGVNVIRIMTEAPGSPLKPGGIHMEDPAGTFDPDMIAFLDLLFELAADYGIYLMITPYDTFWMNHRWGQSPYNPDLGGPVHAARDFLTSDVCFEYQKERWKFLIDRYGGSDYVFAWDLLNEFDIWWDASEEEQLAWVDRMSSFVAQYERQRWGRNHLICVSTAAPQPATGGAMNFAVYRHPNVDFPTTHLYYPDVNNPPDAIAPALAVNAGVKFQLAQIPSCDPRPYLDSESGPIDNWPLPRAFDEEVFHNMTWAHLASGGAGSGLRWPYRNDPHTLTDTMHEYQRSMNRIARSIRWAAFDSRNIDGLISFEGAAGHVLIGMGCADARTALAWIVQDARASSGTVTSAAVRIGGRTEGLHRARIFDTRTAALLSEQTRATSGGRVTVPLPPFEKSVAVVLQREEDEAALPVSRIPRAVIVTPETRRGTDAAEIPVAVALDDESAVAGIRVRAAYDDGSGHAPEQLCNPSAEATRPGGPAGWSEYLWRGAASFSHAGSGRTGSRSLAIASATGADASWWTTARVEPQTDYRLSGWVKTSGVVPIGGRGALLNIHGIEGTTQPVLTGTRDWTRVETVFNSGSRTVVQINATLGGWGRAIGTAWFDDLSLVPVAGGRAWRIVGVDQDPPFEIAWDVRDIPDQRVDLAVDVLDTRGHTIYRAAEIHDVLLERRGGDLTPPFGSLVFPGTNAAVPAMPVRLSAMAADLSSPIAKVQFWIQGTPANPGAGVNTLLGEVFAPPYELGVNLAAYAGTTRWISLDVFDAAGNSRRPADLHPGIALQSTDTIPPQGRILAPADGAVITSLPITIEADASDVGSGVRQVDFYAYTNGAWRWIGRDTTAPYSLDWSPTLANQAIAITIDVTDNAGNQTRPADIASGILYQAVGGDTFPPWAHLLWPNSRSTIETPCLLRAIAGDENSGVKQVTFRYELEGTWHVIGTAEAPPYEILWNGDGVPGGGTVTIAVDVEDRAGNLRSPADSRSDITVIRDPASSMLAVY